MSGSGRWNGVSPLPPDLLSSPPIQERHIVKPRFAYLAVIGMLATAFTLAGCGRKGPVDPPPSSENAPASAPAKRAGSTPSLSPFAAHEKPATKSAFDAEGRPVAPRHAPKQHLPMHWP